LYGTKPRQISSDSAFRSQLEQFGNFANGLRTAMVETILSALAPIVFTLLLGFVAAWRHDFGPKEASVLNRMVLLYAVPLALFVGTVGTPRADLVQDIAFVVAIFAAIVGLYALVFLLFRFVFRFSLSESVLAALTASAPAVPFMGPAILGDLFGKASAVTIAIAALIINLIVVPITILGLGVGKNTHSDDGAGSNASLGPRGKAPGNGQRADCLGPPARFRARAVQRPHPLNC
jgi:predicted permease